jgi:pSer/pThr/pTyr-binding forkhead associated (FHA) protein
MIELRITRSGHMDRVLRLRGGAYPIGRHEDNAIVLDDKEVSRRHARLLVENDVVLIEDLGSGNGTYVGEKPVRTMRLEDGAVVSIEPFHLALRRVRDTTRASVTLEGLEGPVAGLLYALKGDALSLGRGPDMDIVLEDPGASRCHAMLYRRGSAWTIRDNGSANGLLVNGEVVDEWELQPGDLVLIGHCLLRYSVSGSDVAAHDGTSSLDLESPTLPGVRSARLTEAPPPPLRAPSTELPTRSGVSRRAPPGRGRGRADTVDHEPPTQPLDRPTFGGHTSPPTVSPPTVSPPTELGEMRSGRLRVREAPEPPSGANVAMSVPVVLGAGVLLLLVGALIAVAVMQALGA